MVYDDLIYDIKNIFNPGLSTAHIYMSNGRPLYTCLIYSPLRMYMKTDVNTHIKHHLA